MTKVVEIPVLNAVDARVITDRIKAGVEVIWELIKQAYTERAWDALGYSSWDDYCTSEFGTSRLRLPHEERQEVVSSLRESGLSIRAIAAATGMSHGAIGNQVSKNGHLDPADEDALAEELIGAAEPITGTDGKTYPSVQPRRRKPIADSFTTAVLNLDKAACSVERLSEDDRFTKNLDQVAHRLSDLIRARDAMQRVIDKISIPKETGTP